MYVFSVILYLWFRKLYVAILHETQPNNNATQLLFPISNPTQCLPHANYNRRKHGRQHDLLGSLQHLRVYAKNSSLDGWIFDEIGLTFAVYAFQ